MNGLNELPEGLAQAFQAFASTCSMLGTISIFMAEAGLGAKTLEGDLVRIAQSCGGILPAANGPGDHRSARAAKVGDGLIGQVAEAIGDEIGLGFRKMRQLP